MPSTDTTLDTASRQQLLEVASVSVRHGLRHHTPLLPEVGRYSAALREPRASFVTLRIADELRGCIGSLEAYQPLVVDVAHNAFAAAFRDPRFSPLREPEYAALEIHISVLSPPHPLHFHSEADLLRQLRPGVDGLILTAPGHRGTFLPSVWESLPRPEVFLNQLKRKAGLREDFWSDDIQILRYTTEAFSNAENEVGSSGRA